MTAIGPARSERPDRGHIQGLVGVTLHVNRWFKGGTGDTVVVDMPSPDSPGDTAYEDGGPQVYALGTRLLVSGAAYFRSVERSFADVV